MQQHLKHTVVLHSAPSGFISGGFFFVRRACFVIVVSSSTTVYFSSLTIKTRITSVQRATIIFLHEVCLVIFCIGNNIYFSLHHDGWSVDRESDRRLCIIFCNCPDMEDSVNLLIVALTNLSFSFNALKASTGKRILNSFNLATCRPKLRRKSSIDVSGCLRYPLKVS